MKSHNDEELMERITARDEHALEFFIKRFRPLLRTVAGKILWNDQDVDEAVDEVFLAIWNQSANFDSSKGKALGWVITMTRRRAIDRARRCQAYQRASERLRVSSEIGVSYFSGDDVQEHAANADAGDTLQQMMAALPAAQSAVVRMAFYRGLSHRDIARETGIPLGTIKTRLELGVKKLRSAVLAVGSQEVWLGVGSSRPVQNTSFDHLARSGGIAASPSSSLPSLSRDLH